MGRNKDKKVTQNNLVSDHPVNFDTDEIGRR